MITKSGYGAVEAGLDVTPRCGIANYEHGLARLRSVRTHAQRFGCGLLGKTQRRDIARFFVRVPSGKRQILDPARWIEPRQEMNIPRRNVMRQAMCGGQCLVWSC